MPFQKPLEKAATVRKQFEFSERQAEMIAYLKDVCGLSSEKNVIEEALVLMSWAVNEIARGSAIGAFDKDRKLLREITSTAFEKARHWAPIGEDHLSRKK